MDLLKALQILLIFKSSDSLYKQAFEYVITTTKVAGTELDKESTKLLNFLLNLNKSPTLPLSAAELKALPNLHQTSENSKDYFNLIDYLVEMANTKKLQPIILGQLENFLLSLFQNEEELKENENKCPDNIIQIALYLLLLTHYGVYGANLDQNKKKETKFQVRSILSNMNSAANYNDISDDLNYPLLALRKFLHNKDKTKRLWARDICEELKLPLELPMLMELCVEGIEWDKKQSAENLVLVIGPTGSGKSTLINYLYGIKFDYISTFKSPFHKSYLQPKPGQRKPPARAGHSMQSETLFAHITPPDRKNNSYCDCPGFSDNRLQDEAVCASLGVPLAVKYANSIRAVIIVAEWGMFSTRDGGMKYLSLTLYKLFKKLAEIYLNKGRIDTIPLIFAITKPQEPMRGEHFDPDPLRSALMESLKELKSQMEGEIPDFQDHLKRLEALKNRHLALKECLTVPKDFYQKFSLDNPDLKMKPSLLFRIYFGISSKKKDYEEKLILDAIAKQSERWKAQGISTEARKELEILLHTVTQTEISDRAELIDKYRKNWLEDARELKKMIDQIQDGLDKLEGERSILDLMIRLKDNIFIIRGHKGWSGDKDDHRIELLQCIERFKKRRCELSKDKFSFESSSKEYELVRHWLENYTTCFLPYLQAISNVNELLMAEDQSLLQSKSFLERLQIELFCHMHPTLLNEPPNTVLEELSSLKLSMQNVENECATLKKMISENNAEIKKILEAPPVDYGSMHVKEDRYLIGKWIWKNSWPYSFPEDIREKEGFDKDTVIPIQDFELSHHCNENNKLIFNKSISKDSPLFDKINEWAVCEKLTDKSIDTGTFNKPDYNKDKGILKVSYEPKSGMNGHAGVRVFVLPKHLPVNVKKLKELEGLISEAQKFILNKNTLLESLRRKYDNLNTRIQINNISLNQKETYNKIRRIILLIMRLKLSEDNFVAKFLAHGKEHIAWIKDELNCRSLMLLKRGTKEQWEQLGLDKTAMDAMLGNFKSEQESKSLENEEFNMLIKKIPIGFFEKMLKIYLKTALTVSSLHKILITLYQFNTSNSHALSNFRFILDNMQSVLQHLFIDLNTHYQQNILKVRAVEIIASLLSFDENDTVTEFAKLSLDIKEKRIMDTLIPNSPHTIADSLAKISFDDIYAEFGLVFKDLPLKTQENQILQILHKLQLIFETNEESLLNERMAFEWCQHVQQNTQIKDGNIEFFLGKFYLYGVGVSPNLQKAKELFNDAAKKGNPQAKSELEFLKQEDSGNLQYEKKPLMLSQKPKSNTENPSNKVKVVFSINKSRG